MTKKRDFMVTMLRDLRAGASPRRSQGICHAFLTNNAPGMPAQPPASRLQRVAQLALFDAVSLLIVAAPAALVALCTREWLTAIAATGVCICGGLELCGRKRLQRRSAGGILWLCTAQLCCLGFILFYAYHLASRPPDRGILAMLPSFTREQLAELFPDPNALETLFRTAQRITAAAIAFVAILYQGGLVFYYLKSRDAARAVFNEPPMLESQPPPLPAGPPPLPQQSTAPLTPPPRQR